MKKLLLFLCAIGLAFGLVSPAAADMLVPDDYPADSYTNPQVLPNSGKATETAWLENLLGGATVYWYGKDEDNTWNDTSWTEGTYSTDWNIFILKYGTGSLEDPQSHWAFYDDDDHIVDFSGLGIALLDLPVIDRLSHITYFGTASIPEPATMLLLGSGLIGLAGLGRKKFFNRACS